VCPALRTKGLLAAYHDARAVSSDPRPHTSYGIRDPATLYVSAAPRADAQARSTHTESRDMDARLQPTSRARAAPAGGGDAPGLPVP
jgi:hypothetical protein